MEPLETDQARQRRAGDMRYVPYTTERGPRGAVMRNFCPAPVPCWADAYQDTKGGPWRILNASPCSAAHEAELDELLQQEPCAVCRDAVATTYHPEYLTTMRICDACADDTLLLAWLED